MKYKKAHEIYWELIISYSSSDLDDRILKQQQEEEERKRMRREKKKEKKVKLQFFFLCFVSFGLSDYRPSICWSGFQKEKEVEEEPEVDGDIAAMMGFGGFGSSK